MGGAWRKPSKPLCPQPGRNTNSFLREPLFKPFALDCFRIQLEGAAAAFARHIVLIAFAFPQVDLLAEATGAFRFKQDLLYFALEV
jgi:hypothetical protein